jgi:hypothetical protein
MITALLAAPAAPILLLTQTGHFAAAAFLITTAFYAASCAKAAAAEKTPQTELVEKSSPYGTRKSSPYRANNHPTNQYSPRTGDLEVLGVISQRELETKLNNACWQCWSTPIRLKALLLLIADAGDRAKHGVFPFSSDRSRLLCSSLPPQTAAAHNAPREGLLVLTALGVFELVQAGRRLPVARAAEYRIGQDYAKRGRPIQLSVTPGQAERWHNRHERILNDYEKNNPIIAAVRETAARMEFSAQGMEALLRLPSTAPNLVGAAERCYRWLQQPSERLRLDRAGTLHSPISGCPKVIRPLLLLDRQDVVEGDISGAHIAMLTKLYGEEFLGRLHIDHSPEDAQRERQELIAHIESGDVYGGSTPAERKKNKLTLLTSLNMALKAQMAMPVTHELLAGRPILKAVICAVKEKDYRALSGYLQRSTSDIVNASVLSLHARGIPSIPIVDCLMVRRQDEVAAREELSSRLYASTGVCAKVGGIRYTPPALSTNATLIAA